MTGNPSLSSVVSLITNSASLTTTCPCAPQTAVAWKAEELVCHRSSHYGSKVSEKRLVGIRCCSVSNRVKWFNPPNAGSSTLLAPGKQISGHLPAFGSIVKTVLTRILFICLVLPHISRTFRIILVHPPLHSGRAPVTTCEKHHNYS